MKKLLFVEDSLIVIKVIRRLLQENSEFCADIAESFAQAESFIKETKENYFAAVVDLNLPDSPNGEIVDVMLKNKIPTIVLTASMDETLCKNLMQKGVVDYVVKENRYSYSYAIKLITRLSRNHTLKVLVVDDSVVARKHVASLLIRYQFQVVQASGAKQAIRKLVEQPEIRLVITDYHMPDIDGFELVKLIRGKYEKHDLTIIGLSGEGDAALSTKFIKNGANDFLRKPFNQEEFYCRVLHNIELMESVEQLKANQYFDEVTGLYKRSVFFQNVITKIEECCEKELDYTLALIEIDDFKDFNTIHCEYGEPVLKKVADLLNEKFESFYTAKLNLTQFAIFLWGNSLDDCHMQMNDFQDMVRDQGFAFYNEIRHISVSVGFCYTQGKMNLNELLESSEALLLRAQEAGKDIVLYE